MKTRREFLIAGGAGLCALGVPLASLAQQPPAKIPRVGFLDPAARHHELYREFPQGLRDLGYVEGKTIVIEARFAEGRLDRLPALAEELVRLKVDIIVAQSTPGVRAARQATTTTPIVMVAVGDPVGSGFVASLSRPGGNITGMSVLTSDLSPKLLEMLKAAVPKASRIAVLANPGNPNSMVSLKNIQAAAQKVGLKTSPVEARTSGEIEEAFAAIARGRHDAVVVPGDAFFRQQARQIGGLALRHKLPSIGSNPEIVEAGGLLSYGADLGSNFRRAASYVDKILKGAKPADLPVEQPTRFDLVVNRKTARALGLTIPQSILVLADKVIE